MKPIVGVLALWDETRDSIWMLPGYLDGIRQAGGLPVIWPITDDEEEIEQLVDSCDGILFTGGQDVSTDVYGEEPMEGMVENCRERDDMEGIVLKKALEKKKSILGICRGLQFINAALGGSLYQDIQTQKPENTGHRQPAPYHLPYHEVTIDPKTPLYELLQCESVGVNSCHHQGIKKLADGLKAMAAAPDGIVEAFYKPDASFVWAVQWHPEFFERTHEPSRKIFRAFVDAMKEEMNK